MLNATKWNSYFEAIKCVLQLVDKKKEELKDVFLHFKITPLTEEEEEFLSEYVRIMEPFTQALDTLQDEEKMNIGCLLPRIKLLQETMEEFSKDSSIQHCEPMIFCLLGNIQKMFGPMFGNVQLRLAAVSDPNFKTIWVEEEEALQLAARLRIIVRRYEHSKANTSPNESSKYGSSIPLYTLFYQLFV